ncbi:MAG: glycosyltransferase family 2 protein [Leptospiraceae bacterium]|nr:glycosyltransferase family 2 protein [Leptospiraceae bacterium]MCP5497948.1 glycosyltransferase family 2 protein [Leptospiraceae bacterium]
MTPVKIGIIVLHYGKVELTDRCITSLLNVNEPPFEILVVDNKSPESFQNSIYDKDKSIHKIYSESNLGFSGGNNLGIKFFLQQEGFTHILFLNNDTIVDKKFLDVLYRASLEFEIGIFAPVLFNPETSQPNEFGGELDSFKMYFYELTKPPAENSKVTFLCGGCLFYSIKTFFKLGFWDEQFFMYSEDMDYSIRANKLEIPLVVCPKAIVYHKKGGSSGGLAPFAIYYIHRNRVLLAKKHHSKIKIILFLLYYTWIILLKMLKWFFQKRELSKWFWFGYIDGLQKKRRKKEFLPPIYTD